MNDYKELVARLRRANFAQKDRDEAADAIEQLVADKESYKCVFADLHNEIANYCEMIDTLEKERDAAVADISLLIINHGNACKICKYRFGDDPTLCLECDEMCLHGNFEWRADAGG